MCRLRRKKQRRAQCAHARKSAVSVFKYTVYPCVRCVATTSPHAGLASCIAPVVAFVAPANRLLYIKFDRRSTHSTRSVDTLKNRRFFTHSKRSVLTHKKSAVFLIYAKQHLLKQIPELLKNPTTDTRTRLKIFRLLKLLNQLFLIPRQRLRHIDADVDQQIPRTVTVDGREALAT